MTWFMKILKRMQSEPATLRRRKVVEIDQTRRIFADTIGLDII